MGNMRTYLQYKKEKGDQSMPKTLIQLRERCVEVSRSKSLTLKANTLNDKETNLKFELNPNKIVNCNEMEIF